LIRLDPQVTVLTCQEPFDLGHRALQLGFARVQALDDLLHIRPKGALALTLQKGQPRRGGLLLQLIDLGQDLGAILDHLVELRRFLAVLRLGELPGERGGGVAVARFPRLK
jgi:hypothetical protein